MVKGVEANGMVSRRPVLHGAKEMMGKSKKIWKKETMRRSTTMEEEMMVGEPLA